MSERYDQANSSGPPRVAEKKQKFSYFEPVVGIIFAVAATVIFYFFPQIIAIVFVNGPIIPTFDIDVIKGSGSLLWIPIFLWAILRIGVEIFYLVERRYTKRLAVITMIGNILAFVCILIIFVPFRIMNPEHIDWVRTHYINNAAWFGALLARANIVVIVIMFIGLVLDSITVIIKSRKAKAREEIDEDENFKSEEVRQDALIDNKETGNDAEDSTAGETE